MFDEEMTQFEGVGRRNNFTDWSVQLTHELFLYQIILHQNLILILEKEPVFPFSMLSGKQGHYWYHYYNVFGMTLSLTGD